MSEMGKAPVRVAVMGYRHGHVNMVIGQAKAREDTVLVAACDEEAEARGALVAACVVAEPFDDYIHMLDTVECDVIAVGDYFSKRGAVVIEALRRGKHVISDKPLCTRLEELDEIEKLSVTQGLSVGCQFDMRYCGLFRALRRVVLGGELGEIFAISFESQHPLMYDIRAKWYFEEGKHGGTFNDIGIHAVDMLPWVTGLRFTTVNASRNWTARRNIGTHFRDAAQAMFTMENGCGVLGDVSYFTPDSFQYSLPQYHRTTLWGEKGMAETSYNSPAVLLYLNGETKPRAIPPDPEPPGGPFDAFLREVRGEREELELTTAEVLRSSRVALVAQRAADLGMGNISV